MKPLVRFLLMTVALFNALWGKVIFGNDFESEILPLLTKVGCNTGACHGAAAGRGGFKLSLFGSDPSADYRAIVLDHKGRRIHRQIPERSLLLMKPSLQLDHGGDLLFDAESATAIQIRTWIEQGAKKGEPTELQDLRILQETIDPDAGSPRIQLKVLATVEGFKEVDVTAWTRFQVDDAASIQWNELTATATILRSGRHVMIARYRNLVVPIILLRPFDSSTDATIRSLTLDRQKSTNGESDRIDHLIDHQLELLSLAPSDQVDDATLIRRLCLDLHGRLPTVEEHQEFTRDPSPEKRRRFIKRLLESEKFADYWTLKFSRWLHVHAMPNEPEVSIAFSDWIHQCLVNNRGLDQMARELLTSVGDSHHIGPANFARMSRDARMQAEHVATYFLGSQMQCANCHNHPFDRWTQDDYHGLAAIFARLDRGRIIQRTQLGSITNPRTGENAIPRIPGFGNLPQEADGIETLSDWLLDESNPFFAPVQANRVWGELIGRGIVHTPNDFRVTNPPSNQPLLDHLAADFRRSGYRLRSLIERIAMTQAYSRQASVQAIDTETSLFAVRSFRPIEPEVLHDITFQALGLEPSLGNDFQVSRAVQLYDGASSSEPLELLGRCKLGQSCNEPGSTRGLASRLFWINGEHIHSLLQNPKNFFHQKLSQPTSDSDLITECYLRIYSRLPSSSELSEWISRAPKTSTERAPWYEDLVWSMLSSTEFSMYH